MLFCTIITMKFLIVSISLDRIMAKPLETEDYRQYQNSGGNSYTPLLSSGAYGASYSGQFPQPGNSGVFMPLSIPPSSLNSFGSSPYGMQSYGASGYGAPGAFPVGQFPNFIG